MPSIKAPGLNIGLRVEISGSHGKSQNSRQNNPHKKILHEVTHQHIHHPLLISKFHRRGFWGFNVLCSIVGISSPGLAEVVTLDMPFSSLEISLDFLSQSISWGEDIKFYKYSI